MMQDTFLMRVAGTSYRQSAVLRTQVGDQCRLVPEPDNPHDPHAIQVINTAIGEPDGLLGFVPRDRNQQLLEAIQRGCKIITRVEGTRKPVDSEHHGVLVQLVVEYPEEGE